MRMIDLELATGDLNKNLKLYYTTNSIFYPISVVISISDYFILQVDPTKNALSLSDLLQISSSESRQKNLFIKTIDGEKHLILGYRIDQNKLILA